MLKQVSRLTLGPCGQGTVSRQDCGAKERASHRSGDFGQ